MSDEGTAGYCLVPEAGTGEGCGGSLGLLGSLWRGGVSRTPVSCTLSQTPPSSGDGSVASAEGWPPWLLARSLHGC